MYELFFFGGGGGGGLIQPSLANPWPNPFSFCKKNKNKNKKVRQCTIQSQFFNKFWIKPIYIYLTSLKYNALKKTIENFI